MRVLAALLASSSSTAWAQIVLSGRRAPPRTRPRTSTSTHTLYLYLTPAILAPSSSHSALCHLRHQPWSPAVFAHCSLVSLLRLVFRAGRYAIRTRDTARSRIHREGADCCLLTAARCWWTFINVDLACERIHLLPFRPSRLYIRSPCPAEVKVATGQKQRSKLTISVAIRAPHFAPIIKIPYLCTTPSRQYISRGVLLLL